MRMGPVTEKLFTQKIASKIYETMSKNDAKLNAMSKI